MDNKNPKNWIALSRSILDWEWFSDHIMFKVFVGLLLMAGYESRAPNGINLERGQALIGRKKVSEKLGITEQQFRTAMAKLVKTGEVKIQSTNKFSIVTICKYDSYQFDQAESNQQNSNQQINQQTHRQTTSKSTSKNDELNLYPANTCEIGKSESNQHINQNINQQTRRQTTTVNKGNKGISKETDDIASSLRSEALPGADKSTPDRRGDEQPEKDQKKQSPKRASKNEETTDDPFVAVYPVVGGEASTWGLNRSKQAEYIQLYGDDKDFVTYQLREALQWVRDNPTRRKTATGMTRFLGSWLRNSWNSRGGTSTNGKNRGPTDYSKGF